MLAEVEPLLKRNLSAGHIAFAVPAFERALNAQAEGDGVFQGEMSVLQDLDRRAPMGRWAAAADRAAFAHGYRDGYEQALAESSMPEPAQ